MQAPDSGEASSTVDDDLAPGIEVVRQAHGVDLALGRGDRPWTLPIDTLVVSAGPSDGLGTLGSTVRRAMPGLSWNDIRYRDLEPDVPQFLTVSEEGRRRAGGRLRELVVATVREPSRSGDAVASVRSAVRATAAALDAAQGRGATAIGLPLLGAGAAGLDAAAVAAAVVPLVVEQAASARGLRRVVFVCDDDPTEDVIRRAVAGAPGGGPGGRLALRTGAQELVDFTDAVRRARNGSRATGQDALLAVLVRRNRTRLDRGELDRGASAALLRVLPSGDVEERLARALAAAGANADEVLSPGRIRRDVDPGASELADVVGAAERLATLLGGREPRQQQVWSHHIAAAALADLLSPDVAAALGASRATLRSALRDGIGERWPDEDVQRLDWFWADADGARAAVTRYSDVLSDAESPEDAIGITADVHAMAALLAATATAPPLSVALLGNWGSGKSTFMNLLHQRVAALEELARQDETSPFSPIVRQVRFNAWHLSDDHVWVGVVEHLFHGLRGPAQVPEGEVLADGESVSRLRADLAKAEDRRRALERGLDRIDELDRDRGWWGWLHDGLRLVRVGREVRRQAAHELELRRALVPAVLLVVAVAAVFAANWLPTLPGVGGWITAGVSFAASVLAALKVVRDAAARGRDRLAARKRELDAAVEDLESRLDQVDPARGLDALVADLAAGDRYAEYRGLAGRIHNDLARLDRRMAEVSDPRKRQRIILYIDDLDRCTSERVMQVLQVVNLLVGMPLFVVVVAVDPRWLLRALREHHASQMDSEPRALDYLDKIFHIAFAVRPMSHRAGAYLRSLLPVPAATEPGRERPVPDDSSAATDRHIPVATGPIAQAPEERVVRREQPPEPPRPSEELMRLTRVEAAFLPRVAGLLDTPRAVKKTVNLYLLLRATITDNELDAYLGDGRGGPYQAAALLLAATVGCPAEAADLLRCVLAADPAGSVRSVLAEPGDDVPGVALRRRLRAWVETLVDDHPATDDVRCYQAYARAVARYSFESYALFDAPAGRPAEQERTDSQR